MTKHYFVAENLDLATVQKRLIFWFKEREYEVEYTENEGIYLIQAKKAGKLRTVTGTNIALKIKLYWSDEPGTPNEFIFESSTGKWVSNLTGAGVGALFTGGLTILTGIAGAGWAMLVEREILEYMESILKFKRSKTLDDTDKKPTENLLINSSPASSPSPASTKTLSAREKALQKGQQDLAKLETALNNGILTEDEFETKQAALENKIDEYEIEFAVEEQSLKLKQALEQGILEQHEYETKAMALRDTIKERIAKEREERKKADQIAKLKAAVENDILSETEYNAKVAALQ
jgi:hypothetical protein